LALNKKNTHTMNPPKVDDYVTFPLV
jgi:hypothetical protein